MMTVKNPFPKPNHDPPPEIVCVINMKAWEDVTDHKALIRWVRGITDLVYDRVSDRGRIYDHVEAYIVNEIDDEDEIHKYPDVEAWEYGSDLTEAKRFFKNRMQKDNMIYFYISDDQESLSHPYWTEIFRNDIFKAAHHLRYRFPTMEIHEEALRREMKIIYAQGPIEHFHLEPVPQVTNFSGLKKGGPSIHNSTDARTGNLENHDHKFDPETEGDPVGGNAEGFLSFLERAVRLFERL